METSPTISKNILNENLSRSTDAGFFCNLLCLCLFFLVDLRAYSQIAKTGAVTDNTAVIQDKVSVWAVPAEQKVRPEDRVENNNIIWSKDQKKNKHCRSR